MIGIIGVGNMGTAIIERIRGKIIISDIDNAKLKKFKDKSICLAADNKELVKHSDMVILAVKPKDIPGVLKEIRPYVKSKFIISIAAGIRTADIERILGMVRMVRVMPNMACMLGKGISAISLGRYAGQKELRLAHALFSKLGDVVKVNEDLLDAVTAVSGSGPAYYFLFTYLLEKAGISAGLNKEMAERLARAALIGAAEIVKHSDLSMQEFIEKVASKAGTTEAALKVFKQKNLEAIVQGAVKKALMRSKQLSNNLLS